MRPVEWTETQRQELERARDTHPKAYVRERAAALLKIAGGTSAPGRAHRLAPGAPSGYNL